MFSRRSFVFHVWRFDSHSSPLQNVETLFPCQLIKWWKGIWFVSISCYVCGYFEALLLLLLLFHLSAVYVFFFSFTILLCSNLKWIQSLFYIAYLMEKMKKKSLHQIIISNEYDATLVGRMPKSFFNESIILRILKKILLEKERRNCP